MVELVSSLVATNIVILMLAFARIGTALIMMPGFGDFRIPQKHKIALGFILSVLMVPTLPMPAAPDRLDILVALIAIECMVGAFIGLGGRIFMAAFHMLGAQVGFAIGLSNAFAPPSMDQESANMVANLLQLAAVTLIFATNTHHVMIGGILHSYDVFEVGRPVLGDMVEQMARIGASAFYIAASVGTPFIVFAVVMNLALGLANRVMPAMQVFFVAGPLLIVVGLILLALLAAAITTGVISEMGIWYMDLVR